MTSAPETEQQLRAALAAAAPDDTHTGRGLEDLRTRVSQGLAPAPHAAPPVRRRVLAVAAAVVVVAAVVGALALRPDDPPSRASQPPVPLTTTAVPPSEPASGPTAADLTFRPVLSVEACPSDAATPLAADVVADADRAACYHVGPPAADGTDLATADASLQEDWVVNVEARPAAVDAFNTLFNACYDASMFCPPQAGSTVGAIAIVFDGFVISAPAVNGADLASDAFTISGGFTEREARSLAATITAG